jgi:hypothetical protein
MKNGFKNLRYKKFGQESNDTYMSFDGGVMVTGEKQTEGEIKADK